MSDGTTQELAKMARETAGRGRYAIATYVAIAILGLTFGSVCTASTITSADSLQAHSRSDVRTQELTTIARETAGRSRGAIIAYGVFLILGFAALTNTYFMNWNDHLLRKQTLASRLMQRVKPPEEIALAPGLRLSDPKAARTAAGAWIEPLAETLDARSRAELIQAAELALRSGWDPTLLSDEIDYRHEFRRENILSVPVPLTPLRIHINSFTLVLAWGLALLLWQLASSLTNERLTLQRLGRLDEDMLDVVILNSTFAAAHTLLWTIGVTILCLAPVGFAAWQVVSQWRVRHFDMLIDARLTVAVLWWSILGVLSSAVLSVLVLDALWKRS